MKMVKSLLVGIGLAVFAASLAIAADAPPRQIVGKADPIKTYYDWSGFRVGIEGGAGIGASGASASPVTALVPSDPADRMKGWLLGGEIGVRKQIGSVVFGIGANIDWANIENRASSCSTARRTFFATQLADTTSCQTNGAKVKSLYRLTGDIGLTLWERVLWSVKAGLAGGEVSWDNSQSVGTTTLSPTGVAFCNGGVISCPNGAAAGSDSKTKWGYTVGTALEYGITNALSTKLAYDFVDLGSFGGALGSQRVNVHMLTFGFNYRFTGL